MCVGAYRLHPMGDRLRRQRRQGFRWSRTCPSGQARFRLEPVQRFFEARNDDKARATVDRDVLHELVDELCTIDCSDADACAEVLRNILACDIAVEAFAGADISRMSTRTRSYPRSCAVEAIHRIRSLRADGVHFAFQTRKEVSIRVVER